jgi:DNA-directed RNA polymerase specialized sigma24 family protein
MAVREDVLPKHRVLREVYRHYLEFRDLFKTDGTHVIEHGYYVEDENGEKQKVNITISLWDLQNGLKELSPRKREAVFYNVILDKKQKEVAEIMEITTVSVGQYVEQAMLQLSERYFAEELSDSDNLESMV